MSLSVNVYGADLEASAGDLVAFMSLFKLGSISQEIHLTKGLDVSEGWLILSTHPSSRVAQRLHISTVQAIIREIADAAVG